MQYVHGKRVTPLFHEMDLFERKLASFVTKATNYHDGLAAKAGKSATPADLAKLNTDRKRDMDHLKLEAGHLSAIASVQAGINKYREKAREGLSQRSTSRASREAMASESHHPTNLLETYMRGQGRPKPSLKHTAHHVVPGKGKTTNAMIARVHIHLHGIRINDPDNGAWMVRYKRDKGHWCESSANCHLEIHTHNYEGWIRRVVEGGMNESVVRSRLRLVSDLLETGSQPKEVTQKPDKIWAGSL